MRAARLQPLLLVVPCVLAVALVATPAHACPFCGMAGQTLTQESDQAVMILYGSLRNAQLANPNGDGFGMGTTELVLDKKHGVIKEHSFVAGKEVVLLPKYLPTEKNDPAKFLIFCD